MAALIRQLLAFVGVGAIATSLHYLVLIGLVQGLGIRPVTAALVGLTVGGVLSYVLNRRHTFGSERPHDETMWRFALVASVAFVMTYLLMREMVEVWRLPYLPAQAATTLIVMAWTFGANRFWTFREEF